MERWYTDDCRGNTAPSLLPKDYKALPPSYRVTGRPMVYVNLSENQIFFFITEIYRNCLSKYFPSSLSEIISVEPLKYFMQQTKIWHYSKKPYKSKFQNIYKFQIVINKNDRWHNICSLIF